MSQSAKDGPRRKHCPYSPEANRTWRILCLREEATRLDNQRRNITIFLRGPIWSLQNEPQRKSALVHSGHPANGRNLGREPKVQTD
jgi:hypothetical protein